MSAHALLAVLLALLPVPAARRACIVERRAAIEHDADAASAATGVPVAVILAVAYLETHIGCAPRSGGCWGAPISPSRRGTAGRAIHSATALAWGYRACGDALGAVSHYRCGRCRCGRLVGYQPEHAMDLVDRLMVGAAGHE